MHNNFAIHVFTHFLLGYNCDIYPLWYNLIIMHQWTISLNVNFFKMAFNCIKRHSQIREWVAQLQVLTDLWQRMGYPDTGIDRPMTENGLPSYRYWQTYDREWVTQIQVLTDLWQRMSYPVTGIDRPMTENGLPSYRYWQTLWWRTPWI